MHCKPILGNPCRSPKWVMVMDKEEEPHKDGKERVCYGVVQTALGGGLHNTQCHVQSLPSALRTRAHVRTTKGPLAAPTPPSF